MRVVITLSALVGLIIFIGLLAAPLPAILLLLSDDAYYYLNVARNSTLGIGWTFDGTNASNGWHPLWMVVLHPIFYLIDNREWALRSTLILQLLLASGVLVAVWRFIRGRMAGSIALGLTGLAGMLVMAPVPLLLLNGLETSLVLLVELLLIHALAADAGNSRQRAIVGLLIGLLFLARLDSAYIVLSLGIFLLVTELRAGHSIVRIIQRWWLGGLIAALLAAGYFAWNLAEFGHATPISGTFKNSFPDPNLRLGFLTRVPHFALGIIVAVAWLGYRTMQGGSRWHGALFAIGVGCLIHLLWSIVFMAWGTFQWHFVTYVPVVVFAVVDMIRTVGRFERTLAALGLAAVVLTTAGIVALKGGQHVERLKAARWVSENLEPDVRIGLRDAGIFGYFSDQGVVNLDGLINSYEFRDAIYSGEIESFLQDSNVQYTADAYVPCDYERYRVLIFALAPNEGSRLVGESREFERGDELFRAPGRKAFERFRLGETCMVIWRGRGKAGPLP